MAEKRRRTRIGPERRKAQILDEAIRLIGERGYFGFSIQELAQRCEITNPGVLYYFGTKDRLLMALLHDRDRRDVEVLPTLSGLAGRDFGGEAIPLKEVRDIFRATVKRNVSQPELVRLYAVLRAEAMNTAHPAHQFFLEREAGVLTAFTDLLAPHVPEPASMARQLLALMLGLEQQWIMADQAFDLVADWEQATAKMLPLPKASGSAVSGRPRATQAARR